MNLVQHHTSRLLHLEAPFSLAQTAGPVAWTTGRSPRHRWDGGLLTWVGWESGSVVWRQARQDAPTGLTIWGSGHPDRDGDWCTAVLGGDIRLPRFTDPILATLAHAIPDSGRTATEPSSKASSPPLWAKVFPSPRQRSPRPNLRPSSRMRSRSMAGACRRYRPRHSWPWPPLPWSVPVG
jgi:hypothetical protein